MPLFAAKLSVLAGFPAAGVATVAVQAPSEPTVVVDPAAFSDTVERAGAPQAAAAHQAPQAGAPRRMFSKFPGNCRCCGKRFPTGADILYAKGQGAVLADHAA